MNLDERYFARNEIHDAIAFAEAGGIAVHRNFDFWHGGRSARGWIMRKPFLHVIGARPVLVEWAAKHGIPAEAIQPEKRRKVAHIDVFGTFAETLMRRLGQDP